MNSWYIVGWSIVRNNVLLFAYCRVHVVFGRVIEGEQFVVEIENQKVDTNHRPYADVRISNSGELVLVKGTCVGAWNILFPSPYNTVFACRMARCCTCSSTKWKEFAKKNDWFIVYVLYLESASGRPPFQTQHTSLAWMARLLVMNVDTVRNSKSHELFLHTSTNNASTNLCAQLLTYIKFTHEFFYHYGGRCTCMICFL